MGGSDFTGRRGRKWVMQCFCLQPILSDWLCVCGRAADWMGHRAASGAAWRAVLGLGRAVGLSVGTAAMGAG